MKYTKSKITVKGHVGYKTVTKEFDGQTITDYKIDNLGVYKDEQRNVYHLVDLPTGTILVSDKLKKNLIPLLEPKLKQLKKYRKTEEYKKKSFVLSQLTKKKGKLF